MPLIASVKANYSGVPRANRNSYPGLIWHITHRCHKREFLLRFARDRRRWRHWLFKAVHRYEMCVLNYIVTSNHVHVLARDRGFDEIPAAMQLVAGRTAQDYNRRKSRRGAFWEDRYQATAVQDDEHLAHCMTYIDLNMVRAGAVNHPADWDVSGFSEIQSPWKRKGVIDFPELRRLLDVATNKQLADRLKQAAESAIDTSFREEVWTAAVGVGDDSFLSMLKENLGPRALHREIKPTDGQLALQDSPSTYSPRFAPKCGD